MEGFDIEAWEKLLARATAAEASDIHLAPGAPVFLRIYGNITEAGAGPTAEETAASCQELASQSNLLKSQVDLFKV